MEASTRHVVVFDLGGVLARICHTWEEAASLAAVPNEMSPTGRTALTDFIAFDLYQAGKMPFENYLRELALFVGCSEEDARAVHNSIIIAEYPGVPDLVRSLQSQGIRTGCLSNTNHAHWEHLAINGAFPTIQSLEMKMASHLVGINKPDPAIFELYARTFDLDPQDIVYFDDHPLNVAAAARAGWIANIVNPEEDTVAQMAAHLSRLGLLGSFTMRSAE